MFTALLLSLGLQAAAKPAAAPPHQPNVNTCASDDVAAQLCKLDIGGGKWLVDETTIQWFGQKNHDIVDFPQQGTGSRWTKVRAYGVAGISFLEVRAWGPLTNDEGTQQQILTIYRADQKGISRVLQRVFANRNPGRTLNMEPNKTIKMEITKTGLHWSVGKEQGTL